MPSYFTIFSATLPVFLIIAIGFFFNRRGWLNEETEVGVMKLGLNLLVPCLILNLIPGNPALEKVSSAGWAIGLGFALIVLGFGVAWVVARLSGLHRGEGLRTFTISTGIQNYGYLPLPILVELFPDNPGPAGLVFVHGVGVEIAMWTIGLAILTKKSGLRSLVNGPFLAVVGALILNFTGGYHYIPGIVTTITDMLGRCAVPMAIFMIGATMSKFFTKNILEHVFRVAFASTFARIVLLAAIMLVVAKIAPVSDDLKRLLVVQAAMPAAVYPIVLSRLFGGQPEVAIKVVLATSFVSLITSPLVIAWGLSWLGV
ncbi:AEC family transporter [Verrucomicrobiales bacterium BCK34]|nr:AEC family transporter [Verrucomicrobiales bacterium BCK34]